MLEVEGGTVRSVAWSEICPWLGLFRVFRLAISLRVLVFGAAGIALTLAGWWALGQVFSGNEQAKALSKAIASDAPWTVVADGAPSWPASAKTILEHPVDPVFGTWVRLSQPVWAILTRPRLAVAPLAYLVLSALWTLAVWALAGGAISRIAAVQLTSDERVGWGAALRFASSKWLSYFAAPLFPLLGIILLAIPLAILGLLMRTSGGLLLVGLIWPLLLAAGLIMALLLLGLVFGWPLIWATISTEGTDTFDALSRSYAYVFQRPLRYLFYAIVAAVLGWLGWLLVQNFAAAVIWLTYWAAGWGAAGDRIDLIRGIKIADVKDLAGISYAGGAMIRFWVGCVQFLAAGYFYGYFFTAASAMYLLLRRDVDATEMDEVFLDADQGEQTKEPASVESEANGTPATDEAIASAKADPAGNSDNTPA